MKTIFKYFHNHYKAHFNWVLYLYFGLMLAACFYINYTFNFETKYINPSSQSQLKRFFAYFLFYSFAYFSIAIPQPLWGKNNYLREREFWIKSVFFVGVLSLMAGFWVYQDWIKALFQKNHEHWFLIALGSNLKSLFTILLPLLLFKWWQYGRKTSLYGLTRKGFEAKPYLLMLVLVLPLLAWASFQSGFLNVYPVFQPWNETPTLGLTTWQMFGIYEVAYSWDFITTELIFRGALVIGMAKVMKEHCILPMVAVYAFLHFEKPMVEAIGSIFGGFILGVIALYSRSILGGIVIHLCVALLMDSLAIGQYLFF